MVCFAEINALINQTQPRIRNNAAERHIRNACLVQRIRDALQEPRADDAPAAVMNQQLFAAKLPHEICCLCFGVSAKNNLRRCVIRKIQHFHPSVPISISQFQIVRFCLYSSLIYYIKSRSGNADFQTCFELLLYEQRNQRSVKKSLRIESSLYGRNPLLFAVLRLSQTVILQINIPDKLQSSLADSPSGLPVKQKNMISVQIDADFLANPERIAAEDHTR